MNEIQLCLSEMQAFFQSGTTLGISWRKEQLKRLKDGIRSYEKQILNALYEDLGKTDFEGFATELGIVYAEIDEHLKHLEAGQIQHPLFSLQILYHCPAAGHRADHEPLELPVPTHHRTFDQRHCGRQLRHSQAFPIQRPHRLGDRGTALQALLQQPCGHLPRGSGDEP